MTRPFQPFEMERLMSVWENAVSYNLSESGVEPLPLGELLDGQGIDELLSLRVNYPHANGIPRLRERIAALYPGAKPENVLVTVGCIEANFITLNLFEPGDEIAVMMPNYMQIPGLARNLGLSVREFRLAEEKGWALDLEGAVTAKTRAVAVCNPDNPTGHCLSPDEMEAVVREAERAGAWILADEVYAGTERSTDAVTPSFWGMTDRVCAMGSLSKAYGLPGLRIGWVVAPVERIEILWSRHEYVTIAAGMIDNHLAARALEPETRMKLIRRSKDIIRRHYGIFQEWMETFPFLGMEPHEASAVAFVRYQASMPSVDLVERLIRDKGVLVIPGAHFGQENHLRISFGMDPEILKEGLKRIGDLFREIAGEEG